MSSDGTTQPAQPVRTITGPSNPDEISQLTTRFHASLREMLTETLRNARRDGASAIRITIEQATQSPRPEGFRITIEDDGIGINDPAELLAEGADQQRRHYPSLARHQCTITSRARAHHARQNDGTRVELRAEHFLGTAPATVTADDTAPTPSGTRVGFNAPASMALRAIKQWIDTCARHYPIPVEVHATNEDGQTVEYSVAQTQFLDRCIHAEHWQGIRFGVYNDEHPPARPIEYCQRAHDMNNHGETFELALPRVCSLTGKQWWARADVEDCPAFERWRVRSPPTSQRPFAEAARAAARIAIYRAMATHATPRPRFADWARARDAHIVLTPPETTLIPWTAHQSTEALGHRPCREPITDDAILIEPGRFTTPLRHVLARAAALNGAHHRFYESDERLAGYAAYDAIAHAIGIDTRVTIEGNTTSLTSTHAPIIKPGTRAETITLIITLAHRDGSQSELALETDVGFEGEEDSEAEDAGPIVTSDTTLQPHHLAELIADAYPCPEEEVGSDSSHRHRTRRTEEALLVAIQCLSASTEAIASAIGKSVERETSWLVPIGHTAHITLHDGAAQVTVERTGSA